jgi:predicted amidophosphoribosyltransferase
VTMGIRQTRVANGLCADCGKPRGRSAYRCDECLIRKRIEVRNLKACHPWQPGSRGPVPMELRDIVDRERQKGRI